MFRSCNFYSERQRRTTTVSTSWSATCSMVTSLWRHSDCQVLHWVTSTFETAIDYKICWSGKNYSIALLKCALISIVNICTLLAWLNAAVSGVVNRAVTTISKKSWLILDYATLSTAAMTSGEWPMLLKQVSGWLTGRLIAWLVIGLFGWLRGQSFSWLVVWLSTKHKDGLRRSKTVLINSSFRGIEMD